MKFMIMLNGNQAAYDAMSGKPSDGHPTWSEGDLKAMFEHMSTLNDDLAESGEFVDGQGLADPRQARSVTAAADGSPVVSDGPYGETKEVLAGYWIVDVDRPERAYEIAARAHRCPTPEGSAANPPLTVRPLDDPSQAGCEV
ncbi:YciI family protein [Streptomyces odontomachi]|uniref:YciI family protein n=1 Tax=Streptomyces odontomachi TaxID=2944940 RepID=UPI00210970C4|nr:YciI family protein [Streptomyces sp. ODS25]